ncbi:MAG: hypothetical protein E6J61_21100 [Deltaproteobacteria bacterium]|nr:MAG: hypothetical protein E6J61_21100 [Deltaproteobacteria bacterium]
MKKTLLAILAGTAVGIALAAATSGPSAAATANCGPLTCTAHQECCMSPHPFTFRCVKPGTCPYNN